MGVVAGPERLTLGDRLARDALVERLVGVVGPDVVVGFERPGGVRPAEQPGAAVDEVDAGAVRAQQASRLVDRALEHVRQVRGGRDAGVDLAQAAFDLGPVGQHRAGLVEGGDQPRVGDGRGGMVGQRADQGDLGGIERVGATAERAERAVHLVAGTERGHDHGVDPDVGDDLVRAFGVGERRVVGVVLGDDDGALLDRAPEHAGPRLEDHLADPCRGCACS